MASDMMKSSAGMEVLVTGHLGYVGTVTATELLAAGAAVTGCDINIFDRADFPAGGEIPIVPNLAKDIRDLTAEDLRGFDAVVHLAALSNDPLGQLRPGLTRQINHEATVNLASCAKRASVRRFVFASSCSSYGKAGNTAIDEDGILNPQTEYGLSKVLAERDLKRLADSDFSPVFLRFATAYGVSPRMRFDIVLNNLVANACVSGRILLMSDGTPWRPIVHVQDMARSILATFEIGADLLRGEAFNVCPPNSNYRIRDIAEIVAKTVPGARIEYTPGAGPDKRSYRVSSAKIERLVPGFHPGWSAETGAQQLYDAINRSDLTIDDINGRKYTRLSQLKSLIAEGAIDDEFRPSTKNARIASVD